MDVIKNIIESDVESKNTMMALRKTEKDIELALTDCKSAHAKMFEISNGTSAENEIEWIRKIQTRYNETIEKIETFTATIEDEKKTKQSSPLRLHYLYVSRTGATRRSSRSCSVKRIPSFLSYFMTLKNFKSPGIEPATSRSAVKRSTD